MNNLTEKAYRFILTVMTIFKGYFKEALSLLASSAETSDANNATQNAARSGVLNYRTGKFDDGTDANGWYEKD